MPLPIFASNILRKIPKSFVAGCLILTTGVAATVFFVLRAEYMTRNSDTGAGEVEIFITDQGFEPDVITIPIHTRVTWTNKGTQEHWPASDFHPTHTMYPSDVSGCIGSALDACRGLKPGERYSFIFDTVGIWGMHDHLYPGLLMTIRATSSQEISHLSVGADEVPSNEFLSLDNHRQKEIIQKKVNADAKEAWDYLKRVFMVNDQIIGNAHGFAHLVGNGIYHNLGLEGIVVCDETFAYGCYHGVTEAMLLHAGVSEIPLIEKNCLSILKGHENQDYTGCIHGIGHGLVTWSGLNVKKALMGCDALHERYRPYCYDGVFMEYADSLPKKAPTKNLWEFCDSLEQRYQYNCARYQALLLTNVFGLSFRESGQACSLAQDEKIREACLGTLGHIVAQQEQSNKEKIITRCSVLYKEEGYAVCIMSAAREIKFQRYDNWEKVADALCDSLVSPWKGKCHEEGMGTGK